MPIPSHTPSTSADAPRRGRRRAPLNRRTRVLVSAGAVVALLGTAAFIGGDKDERSTETAGAFDQAKTSADRVSASGSSTASEASLAAGELEDASPTTSASAGDTKANAYAVTGQTSIGAPLDAKIIRMGSLDVEVAKGKFDAASARLTTIAADARGFISASEVSAMGDDPHGSITLRVPAARFDAVIAQIRKIGDIQAINTGSQDVTGEYTDVAARLKALQSEREQINLVLSRAETIPDILSVRDRLSVVQGEIEQLQGRQKVLDDQTSLSTLTVTVSEKGSPAKSITAPPSDRSGFSKLWHDSAERFTDGGRAIALGLASMAPWLLLALLLFLPGRAIWRRTAPAI